MNDIRNVTGTAFVVAEFRASENREPNPIYVDPVVPAFLDERTQGAAAIIAGNFPPGVTNVKIRTRYFDDRLARAIAGGCRQVVILGAGLDTRAERHAAPDVAYFEIDDADTLDFKRKCLEAAGYKAQATFIPGDYVASGVLPLLDANGFDRTLPSFFIWEGNTMYLTRDMDIDVLRELKDGLASFSIAFDYMSEEVIACTTGDDGVTGFVERFAAMGAPWITGINDVAAFAKEARLLVADNTTTAALHRAYWPGRPITSCMFDHYSVCTLNS